MGRTAFQPRAQRTNQASPQPPASPHGGVIPRLSWKQASAWKVLSAGVTLGACAVAFWPISTSKLTSHAEPSAEYAEALARFEQLRAQDGSNVNPICASRLLTHGTSTERVVVLLHGVTNCPQQFVAFGESLFARGYNVLIPRMPHNGFADRMAEDLRNLRANELAAFADTVVDIATGLGTHVTIVGLSAGGILAAWAAQYRGEIARAVIVAPSFAILHMSPLRRWVVQNLSVRLPPIPRVDSGEFALRKPRHTSLRNNSRAIGEVMRLGLATYRAAKVAPPAARSLVVVTNAADATVDNTVTTRVVERWRAAGHTDIDTYTFPGEPRLPHDMIDPDQPEGRVERVYPVLLDVIERA